MAKQVLTHIEHEGQTIWMVGPTAAMLNGLEAGRRLIEQPGAERMVLMIGDQGMGKTLSSRLYASQHEDVTYVQVPPASILRPGRLLQMIEGALDLPMGGPSTLFDRTHSIIAELRRRPRLLVFDNANRFRKYDYIDLLRYIHDEAAVPMAFVSIPSLRHVFEMHREFMGRVALSLTLTPPSRAEVGEILGSWDPAAVDALYDLTGGRMREVMVLARHFERHPNVEVSDRAVRRVAAALTIRGIAA